MLIPQSFSLLIALSTFSLLSLSGCAGTPAINPTRDTPHSERIPASPFHSSTVAPSDVEKHGSTLSGTDAFEKIRNNLTPISEAIDLIEKISLTEIRFDLVEDRIEFSD